MFNRPAYTISYLPQVFKELVRIQVVGMQFNKLVVQYLFLLLCTRLLDSKVDTYSIYQPSYVLNSLPQNFSHI